MLDAENDYFSTLWLGHMDMSRLVWWRASFKAPAGIWKLLSETSAYPRKQNFCPWQHGWLPATGRHSPSVYWKCYAQIFMIATKICARQAGAALISW